MNKTWGVAGAVFLLVSLLLIGKAPGVVPGGVGGAVEAMVSANLHWQVHERGLSGYIADDLHGYPYRTDRLVADGLPMDAWLSWPFTTIFGEAVGLWLWLGLLVVVAGVGAARLAGKLWGGSLPVLLIAGVGYQLSEPGLRQLADGRFASVFAWSLLPYLLPLGPFSGMVAGVIGLVDPALGLAALGILGLGLFWEEKWLSLGSRLVAGWAVVVGMPLAWVVAGRGELPSFFMDPWSESLIGFARQKPVDMVAARIFGWGGVMMGTLARPALLVGCWLVVRDRAIGEWRRLAVLALLGALFGLGPYLPGPLVLPAGLLLELPGLQRIWWSDRWWSVVGLIGAVLAAGALFKTSWQRYLLAGAVLIEPWLLSRLLPLSKVPLQPSDAARVLGTHPDVPFVLLPTPGGRFRPDRMDLIDQIGHGRPMANGTRPPLDLRAPDALLRGWRDNAGLRGLLSCEANASPQTTGKETFDLLYTGIRAVYVDLRYTQGSEGESYLKCVEQVLAGWVVGTEQPPFQKYEPPTTP